MVQKIKDLKTEITDDQIELEWAQVFSKRNKLLDISDWTQLSDVFLHPKDKKIWSEWRQKLRRVNKTTIGDLSQATILIELLEKEIPKDTRIDEAQFDANVTNRHDELDGTNIKERTVVVEKPTIMKVEMSNEELKSKIFELFNTEPDSFKQFLTGFLYVEDVNLISDSDTLDSAKQKTILFCKKIQNDELKKELDSISNLKVLNQKLEEALTFIVNKNADIDGFPLIKLYSEEYNITSEESAIIFLKEKKKYNKFILESEKKLVYNLKRIEEAQDIATLKSIVEDTKNGYRH